MVAHNLSKVPPIRMKMSDLVLVVNRKGPVTVTGVALCARHCEGLRTGNTAASHAATGSAAA